MNHLDKKIVLEKLTPAQRRVVIAKDVIAALDAKKINAMQGTYCDTDLNFRSISGKSLREALPAAKKCDVCALGALFMAKVGRFNDFTVDTHNAGYSHENFGVGSQETLHENLKDYFTPIQLGLIETAFENNSEFARWAFEDVNVAAMGSDNYELLPEQRKLVSRAKRFTRAKNTAERMRKIMLNIVTNRGEFKP